MARRKLLWTLVLVPLFWQSPVPTVFAQTQSSQSLGGLTSMHVRVNPDESSDAETMGVDTAQLRSDTERLLAEAGIKIIPSEGEFERLGRSRGYPLALLDVNTRIYPIEGVDLKVYFVNIRLRQVVFLSRKPIIRWWAPSWEMRDMGTTNDMAVISEKVKVAVNRLIQDFKTENPP